MKELLISLRNFPVKPTVLFTNEILPHIYRWRVGALETAKPKEVFVTNTQEPFLDTKTIAQKLGISLVTLRQWRKLGLPAHKQNRRVYFLYSEVMG